MNTQQNNAYQNGYQVQQPLYPNIVTTQQTMPVQTFPNNQASPMTSDMTWVQGIEGARAYNLPPNSAKPLWDSERSTIYLKMTDASGIPKPLRIFDYTERVEEETKTDYVTADQLNELLDEKFNALAEKLNNRPYQKKGGKYNGKQTVQPSES